MGNESTLPFPPLNYFFKVLFNGAGINGESSFSEVSGLQVDIKQIEIQEGGELRFKHKLPVLPKYKNLVLKRGLLHDSKLRDWITKALYQFEFEPLAVSIFLMKTQLQSEQNPEPLMAWVAHNVWPLKWEVGNFSSTKQGVAIETLELSYNYFEIKPQ